MKKKQQGKAKVLELQLERLRVLTAEKLALVAGGACNNGTCDNSN